MLEFEEFIKTPRCRPLILSDEDQPQDQADWRKLEKEDQHRQYDIYVKQFQPKETEPSQEEKRVVDKLRNTVTLQSNGNKSRAKYMRSYRKRPKFCPHCKKRI